MENLYLIIPDESHEKAYTEMISRWEKLETNINPSLLGRYSGNKKRNLTYAEWLALEKCREMGFGRIEICTHKDNIGAIKTITANGGVLTEEFFENDIWSIRHSIEL